MPLHSETVTHAHTPLIELPLKTILSTVMQSCSYRWCPQMHKYAVIREAQSSGHTALIKVAAARHQAQCTQSFWAQGCNSGRVMGRKSTKFVWEGAALCRLHFWSVLEAIGMQGVGQLWVGGMGMGMAFISKCQWQERDQSAQCFLTYSSTLHPGVVKHCSIPKKNNIKKLKKKSHCLPFQKCKILHKSNK